MDVGIATAMVILLCPLMVLVICLISAVMGPPILFAHRRIGYAGKVFNCYKFRTMVAAPDDILITHLERNSDAAREWQEKRKLRNDPRVTELGRILRKSSLDELPQLFNVLRGDMSCVGPRPVVAEELPLYGEHAGEYLKVRPGLTGLWQVSGRADLNYDQRVAFDCHYVRSWSIWADLVILARTIFVLAKFRETA
jgi:exopolysaccharide production protein ExoY